MYPAHHLATRQPRSTRTSNLGLNLSHLTCHRLSTTSLTSTLCLMKSRINPQINFVVTRANDEIDSSANKLDDFCSKRRRSNKIRSKSRHKKRKKSKMSKKKKKKKRKENKRAHSTKKRVTN